MTNLNDKINNYFTMVDLFENFFGRIGQAMNGGKSHQHYGGTSQVNAGRHYNYHENGSNNKYWLPKTDLRETFDHIDDTKPRMDSVASTSSDVAGASRKSSVATNDSDT